MIHRFVDLISQPAALNDPLIIYKLHHGIASSHYERYWLAGGGATPDALTITEGDETAGFTINGGRLSPDKSQLTWSDGNGSSAAVIYVGNSDDTGTPTVVATAEDTTAPLTNPMWHPDGTKLIYLKSHDFGGSFDGAQIRQVAPDGTGDTLLYERTTGQVLLYTNVDYGILYNRDGNHICWVDQSQGVGGFTNAGLWVMDGDGSNATLLQDWSDQRFLTSDRQLGWANNSDLIAYTKFFSSTLHHYYTDLAGNETLISSDINVELGHWDYRWLPDDSGLVISYLTYGTEPKSVLSTLALDGTVTAISPERRIWSYSFSQGQQPVVFGDRIYYYDISNHEVCSVFIDGSDFRVDHTLDPSGTDPLNDQSFRTFLLDK